MQLEKLKLKEEIIFLYNVDSSIEEKIKKKYVVKENSNQILLTIIKEDELIAINEFIENLDFSMDFIMWILYPKGTSKEYKGIVEVNRDDIRTKINDKVKTVSMVSLDENWSAMRLRNKKYSK